MATKRKSRAAPRDYRSHITAVATLAATLANTKARAHVAEQVGVATVDPEITRQRSILDLCAEDFRHFLPYWHFVNREGGGTQTFGELWEGQKDFADVMMEHPWVFALKAGKLGFTELECAFDAWVLRFRQSNARVHIFSKENEAAKELLDRVKFGYERLPAWMRWPILKGDPGGDTTRSFKIRNPEAWDDVRTVVAYPTGRTVAIDQSATHSHVDELSHMTDPRSLWNSVATTVAPGGSCHVVTRGAGDDVYTAELWHNAEAGTSQLYPFFANYLKRPREGGHVAWRAQQSGMYTAAGLAHYAPESPEDALMGEESSAYIPVELWDQLTAHDMPPFLPSDRTQIVLGVDAATTGDYFAIAAISRHWDPLRKEDTAVRATKVWKPREFEDGRIDYSKIETWLRGVCKGICPNGHPPPILGENTPDCGECIAGNYGQAFNVVQIVYDPYQLEDMMQRLRRGYVAWCDPMSQGDERLIADGMLYRMAQRHAIVHTGDAELREHVQNAAAWMPPNQDTRMRIIKKSESRKIDLIVAVSMANKRSRDLLLS